MVKKMDGGSRRNAARANGRTRRTRGLWLVVLLAVLAAAFARGAQAEVLVGNHGQRSDHTSGFDLDNDDGAQAFTTGGNSRGYILKTIALRTSTGETGQGELSFAVVRKDNPATGELVATLSGTGYFLEKDHLFHLTAPHGTRLEADTTYFLVLRCRFGDECPTVRDVKSGGEDAGGLAGWSIGDRRSTRPRGSNGGFSREGGPLYMRVYGREVADGNRPPTGANGRVRVGYNRLVRFSKIDFGFSDPDRGDSLESITITHVNPGWFRFWADTRFRFLRHNPFHGESFTRVPRTIPVEQFSKFFMELPNGAVGRYTFFKFKVSDGQAQSAQTYTMRIDVDPCECHEGTPALESGRHQIDGDELDVFYRMPSGHAAVLGPVDPTPPTSAYDVRVDGTRVDVRKIKINHFSRVRLILSESVLYGSKVTVSYTKPRSNPVHLSGYRDRTVDSFSNLSVRNITQRPSGVSLPTNERTGHPDDPLGRGVWGARLSAGEPSGSEGWIGYDQDDYGALSSRSFRLDGRTHPVSDLKVHSNGELAFRFQGELSEARRDTLALIVGKRSFRLDRALHRVVSGHSQLDWANTGLSWSAGQRFRVYLVDQNRAPRFGLGNNKSGVLCKVDEHVAQGTAVCTYPARDPEGAGPVTYRLGGRDARFYRVGSRGTVYTNVPAGEFDYESREFYVLCKHSSGYQHYVVCHEKETQDYKRDEVTLIATDRLGRSGSIKLKIQVEDAADPPPPVSSGQQREAVPMTLELRDFPRGHDGSTPVTFELAFSEAPVDATPERIAALVSARNATVREVRRAEEGDDRRWAVELAPTAADDWITVSIFPAMDCAAANAICSAAGAILQNAFFRIIPYAEPVAARFVGLPAAHQGTAAVSFEIVFDPEPADLTPEKVKANLTVTNGRLGTVSPVTEGSNARWRVTVTPTAGNALGIALRATTDCNAANAICTWAGGRLEIGEATSIASLPPLTVAYAEGHEPPADHDGTTTFRFRISFSEEPESGFSYRNLRNAFEILQSMKGGWLIPAARFKRLEQGRNRHWEVSVAPRGNVTKGAIRIGLHAADDCESASSICTADGRRLANTVPLHLVSYSDPARQQNEAEPVTVEVLDFPGSHDGSANVTFELAFSEVPVDATPARIAALVAVTNGSVHEARRVNGGSDLRWTVELAPAAAGTEIQVSIPATTDCSAANAICSAAGGMLETGASASIPYAPQISVQREQTPAAPIVATFAGLPANHDGGTAVSFEIVFDPEPADLTPETVKANLSVSRGTLGTVSRVTEGGDARWSVTVTPTAAALGIALNPTVDCGTTNAICTAEGGRLENGRATSIAYAPPLTVAYAAGHEPPAEHDGETAFTFRFGFSEPLGSYDVATMRDHSLRIVQGGTRLTPTVRRLNTGDNANRDWEATVTPGGKGPIAIALGPTSACTETGAMCTPDGRALSNALPSRTVRGPAEITIEDTEVVEAPGATLDFRVRMSRAESEDVTIRYGTRRKTAIADLDYHPKKEDLTIPAGQTEATISIAVIDDTIDEEDEWMEVWISRPRGGSAWIRPRTAARGTIRNDDPMPHAWLARFGRTVAGQAVDMIAGRLDGGGGTRVTVGGQALDFTGAPMTDERREELESAFKALAEADDPEDGTRSMAGREALLGSAFQLSAGGEEGAPAFAAWGRFATGGFDAEEGGARMDGSVTSGFLGADMARGRWLAGLAVGLSEGEGGYASVETGAGGDVETAMTALYPYGRLSVTERLDLWGLAGFGQGELEMTHGHGDEAEERFRTDVGMRMGAVGARGEVLTPAERGGLALAVKSDAFWVRTTSDAVRAREDAHGNLAAAEADASRLRLTVEGSRSFEAGAGTLTPSLEVGLRHDGGDAETGTGVEVGAALRYAGEGVSIEGAVRTLVAHEESGYEEWGASGAVRIDPGMSGRGLSLTLAPSWGVASGGAERLWGMEDARGFAPEGGFEAARSFEAELGYGVGLGGMPGTVTPYAGLSLGGEESRAWRGGAKWAVAPGASVSLEGTRTEAAGAEPVQEVKLRGALRW